MEVSQNRWFTTEIPSMNDDWGYPNFAGNLHINNYKHISRHVYGIPGWGHYCIYLPLFEVIGFEVIVFGRWLLNGKNERRNVRVNDQECKGK